MTNKEAVQAAILSGLIQPPQARRRKRGPKADPEIQKAYLKAKTLWESQLKLDEVCRICGISVNTFRWKYYNKERK